ncbi:MAG TPA: response regulator, partial [Gemmatimonadaceae bacterium]|nr:response regulator [Gemmatimonadaceae bacterium]
MTSAELPEHAPLSGLSPIRVLIVDAEALGRIRVHDLLRNESGVEVIGEAADGEAAIAAIRELKPDLVFLDVQMPKKSGLDVVNEIGAEQMPMTIFV